MSVNITTRLILAGLLFGTLALTFNASANAASRTEIKRIVIEEAERSSVPPALALAVAKIESDFHDRVRSHKGARGVMQIMPKTAREEFGIDPDELWDPRLNVQLGIDFLERLYVLYGGEWELALSHYNGGTLKGGKGSFAKPHSYTRKYVTDVMRWWKRYQDQADVWGKTKIAGTTIDNAWVPARTTGVISDSHGDPDPKTNGDIEYRLRATAKTMRVPTIITQAPQIPRPVVRWSRPANITRTSNDQSAVTKGGHFWDRVSRARKTLDDFGPESRGKRS